MSNLKKTWFVWLDGQEEGPCSVAELRCNPKVTPDTLARKIDSKEWKPIREIPELQELFEDSKPIILEPEEKKAIEGDELTLTLQDPSPFWLWLLVIVIVFASIILFRF